MMQKVSIVVPCFNQGHFLPEALDSVLAQTYPNWECIIVNDGSTDNTEEVGHQYCKLDDRFRYIKKENGGLSSARNAGLQVATGDFIQFLDGDDLLTTNKLSAQVKFLEEHEQVDLVYCMARYFESSSQEKLLIYGRNFFYPFVQIDVSDSLLNYNLFYQRNFFVVSAPLVRKSMVKKIGFFDTSLSALEDWDYWIRAVKNGCIMHCLAYQPTEITLIRISEGSMMTNNINMKYAASLLTAKHNDVMARKAPLEKKIWWKKWSLLIMPPIVRMAYVAMKNKLSANGK